MHDHEAWERFVAEARERVVPRQAALGGEYGLGGDVQYRWSMEDASIVWATGGRDFLAGRITVLGSVSHDYGTWLWSWANDDVPDVARGDIARVREFGEEHGFPVLASAGFRADGSTVPAARIAAADLLGADGLWLEGDGPIELHFALHDLRVIEGDGTPPGTRARP